MCGEWRLCWSLLGVGAVLVVLSALSIPLLHHVVHKEVHKRVSLHPGSDTYDIWRDPSVPIYLEVYVFDLKNTLEVLDGEKPYVEQKGPYVYREYRKKEDVVHNCNGTITYKQNKVYVFDREKSVGWDNDTFTTINMPLVTFVEYIYWHRASELSPVVSVLLRILSEDLFITRSVRDVVWGYRDEMLSSGKVLDPNTFYTDQAGVLAGKNNTDDGVYTIFSGVYEETLLGVIFHYNSSRSLNFWTSPSANMVNGTDGTLSRPFISKDLVAYMFSTDICRSVYGVYHGPVVSAHGLTLWRFQAPQEIFASASENPDNAGFCTPPENCMGGGVLNISTCSMLDGFHVPVVASLPHFHMADRRYQDAILNLDPHQDHLTVDIDIEPISGIVMNIAKRLQINMYVRGGTGIKQMKSIKSMVYPILWVNETATVDANHAAQVYTELLQPLIFAQVAQYVTFAVGAVTMLAACVGYILKRRQLENYVVIVANGSSERLAGEEVDQLHQYYEQSTTS